MFLRRVGLLQGSKQFSTTSKTPGSQGAAALFSNLPTLPKFATLEEERLHRKQRLAGAFRLFSKFGFNEGVAGQVRVSCYKG